MRARRWRPARPGFGAAIQQGSRKPGPRSSRMKRYATDPRNRTDNEYGHGLINPRLARRGGAGEVSKFGVVPLYQLGAHESKSKVELGVGIFHRGRLVSVVVPHSHTGSSEAQTLPSARPFGAPVPLVSVPWFRYFGSTTFKPRKLRAIPATARGTCRGGVLRAGVFSARTRRDSEPVERC